jgi:hypothetical protein
LERLGWRLTRVWSTDWFHDARAQTERLSREIGEAIEAVDLSQTSQDRLVTIDRVAVEHPAPEMAPSPSLVQPFQPREVPSIDAKPDSVKPLARRVFNPRRDCTDLRAALRDFRERIIAPRLPDTDPARSILRDEMIEAIVSSKLDDQEDFHRKIPPHLRSATDGRQVRYLRQICDLVADSRHAQCQYPRDGGPP